MAINKEFYAFIISLSILIPILGVFIYTLHVEGLDALEAVMAVLGGYMSTILVYYFGQKNINSQTERAENAEKNVIDAQKITQNSIAEAKKYLKNWLAESHIGQEASRVLEELQKDKEKLFETKKNDDELIVESINILEELLNKLGSNMVTKAEVNSILNKLKERKAKVDTLDIDE